MGDNWPRAHKQIKYYQAQAKLSHRTIDPREKQQKITSKEGKIIKIKIKIIKS